MIFSQTAHAASSDSGISIHLAPQEVFSVFGVGITNTLMTVWLAMGILIIIAVVVGGRLRVNPGKGQILFETLIGFTYDYIKELLGSEKLALRFYPLVLTIFLFVLTINWVGLLPGVESIGVYTDTGGGKEFTALFHPGNTDLNHTIALALISFVVIHFSGFVILGIRKYAGKFFNFSSPLAFLVGIIELFSEFARLISFSFRLFGNMFAGSVLLLVIAYFIPYIVPVPFMAFELFVGFIQAFIFAILTLFFIKIAVAEPEH